MLPKIEHPVFEFKIPSTNHKIKMRPYLVKEEKILLIAKESGDFKDILSAIIQVVNNCIIDNVHIENLSIFDIEYLFSQLRGISVDNIIKLSLTDSEDNENYDFEFQTSDIKVNLPEKQDLKILIDKSTGIYLKYPSALLYKDDSYIDEEDSTKKIQIFLSYCIDKIFTENEIYKIDESNRDELFSFLDNLNLKTYQSLLKFIDKIPSITYTLSYTNKLGKNVDITLNKLTDFFIL